MTRIDSYNNWIISREVERYKYARNQLKILVDTFEKSDPSHILDLEEYIIEAYWGNVEDFGGDDLKTPDLAKLLILADRDWEFARILNNIHHYISLIINTTPNALPILKDAFYHMVDTIKRAACEIRLTEKADFEPLNKFELAYDAIEHFTELTKTTSKLMIMTTEVNTDSKAASEAAEKLAGIAESTASKVYFNGSCERIVKPSVLEVFLNENTRSLYHISMNHLLFMGDTDSIDEISYIHDQARDIISYSLSHYKTENGDISIMAPEIHKLLTQLAAELREVKTKWPIAELEPSATETETVRTSSTPPDKHELTDTERNILDALNDKTIRGRNLLKKAGYDYSSHYRGTLSNLIKRGILANHGKGYFKPTDDACHD